MRGLPIAGRGTVLVHKWNLLRGEKTPKLVQKNGNMQNMSRVHPGHGE